MPKMIAACGLNCSECEAYLAYQAKDQSKLEEVASKWSINYQTSLSAADIRCDGCLGGGLLFQWCNECPIRACVHSKNFQTCAECADFPCQTNAFLYQAAPEAKANIESLQNF